MMFAIAAPLVASFVVATVITPVLRSLSHRHGLLDVPNDRSSHVRPTPRSGGIAIIAAVVLSLVVLGEWRDARLAVVLALAAGIAGLGLVDDFRTLGARLKLAVQTIAAVLVVVLAEAGLTEVELPLGPTVALGALALPVTVFWIVGVTNAYNFMDGINGIASIEGIICGGTYGAILLGQGDHAGAALAFSLAGACAGFLPWNAGGSIFMGDVGSGTIGFLFAVLSLRVTSSGVPFVAAVLPLLPFLFDTSVTLARRAVRRERLFAAHRSHLYQQLTDLGWPHLAVSALWGAMAVACAGVAIRYDDLSGANRALALSTLAAICAFTGAAIAFRHSRRARRP